MQIAEGVFQFQVPMPRDPLVPDGGLRYTFVYAVKAPQGWVLIDAGMNTDAGFQALRKQLSEAGVPLRDIVLLIVTHAHHDHAGLANRVKEVTGARVAMHRLDSPGTGNPSLYHRTWDAEAARRFLVSHGFPPEEAKEASETSRRRPGSSQPQREHRQWEPPLVDVRYEGGEEVLPDSGLWARWTPGHTAGHLCVHDARRRLLFSGDHVLPSITPHVSLSPGEKGDPLGAFLESLRGLSGLDVDMVHPAHERSFPGLANRVDELLRHHEHRTQELLAQLRDGPRTAYQVASGITWNVAPWRDLRPVTRRMALMETLAHLQHLVLGRTVHRSDTGETVAFGAAGGGAT